jgi:hypothetical protein
MATISPDGKTVLKVADWKAELSVTYILKSPGEVEHRLCYFKRDGGRTQVSLKEFLAERKARGKTAMTGKVAQVRHQRTKAFSDELLEKARIRMSEGQSLRAVAKELGVNHGTLSSRLKRDATPVPSQTEGEVA